MRTVLANATVIDCVSPRPVPGASVTVDDQAAGVTPLTLPLAAGPHRVVVTADGWSSYERQVEIHPEGTTQMTANLVRPLGYVEPTPVSTEPRGFISISGGGDATGDAGGLYNLLFGGHRGRFDFGLGYGFVNKSAAFALDLRGVLTRTRVRPYLRASALLGSASSFSGHAGVLARVGTTGRAHTSVFVDVGIGIVRDPTAATDDADRALFIPLMGGVQLSY